MKSKWRKVAKFTEALFVYVNDSWKQCLCYRTTIVVFKKKKTKKPNPLFFNYLKRLSVFLAYVKIGIPFRQDTFVSSALKVLVSISSCDYVPISFMKTGKAVNTAPCSCPDKRIYSVWLEAGNCKMSLCWN